MTPARRDEMLGLLDDPKLTRYAVGRAAVLPEMLTEVLAELDDVLARVNVPEVEDFAKAVVIEAAHQRVRWGQRHDSGKAPSDWFWLLGWLAGKAVHALATGDVQKGLHHVITTAAACANWHAQILGKSDMRPGIDPPKETT